MGTRAKSPHQLLHRDASCRSAPAPWLLRATLNGQQPMTQHDVNW
jgi:hypothetical protein